MTYKKNEIKIIDDLELKNLSGAGIVGAIGYMFGLGTTLGLLFIFDAAFELRGARAAFSKNTS